MPTIQSNPSNPSTQTQQNQKNKQQQKRKEQQKSKKHEQINEENEENGKIANKKVQSNIDKCQTNNITNKGQKQAYMSLFVYFQQQFGYAVDQDHVLGVGLTALVVTAVASNNHVNQLDKECNISLAKEKICQQYKKVAIKIYRDRHQSTRHYHQYQIQVATLQYFNEHKIKGIPHIINYGEYDGFHYIIMQHCGHSLAQLLKNNRVTTNANTNSNVNSNSNTNVHFILREILTVLNGIHSCGLIHHDFKMENVCIKDDSVVFVVDFGTVHVNPNINMQLRGQKQDNFSQSQCIEQQNICWQKIVDLDQLLYKNKAFLVGSRHYCPPELVSGKKSWQVSQKIDMWAFGIICYKILCGRYPFQYQKDENNWSFNKKIRSQEPLYPQHLVQQQLLILKRCLQKDPKNRASAADLLQIYRYQTISDKSQKSMDANQIIIDQSHTKNRKVEEQHEKSKFAIKLHKIEINFDNYQSQTGKEVKRWECEIKVKVEEGQKYVQVMKKNIGMKYERMFLKLMIQDVQICQESSNCIKIKSDNELDSKTSVQYLVQFKNSQKKEQFLQVLSTTSVSKLCQYKI